MRQAKAAHAEFQVGVLRDGRVTKAEYEESLAREAKCSGLPIPKTIISPIDGLRLVPLGDDYRPTVECNHRYRALVEVGYVEIRQQVMEPRVQKAILECVRKLGYQTSDSWDTIRKMTDGLGKESAQRALGRCGLPAVQLFYPEVKGIGFSY